MDTAHQTVNEKKEYFDSPDLLEAKVTQLADMIKSSKHFVCFTGAGISTSAGIADFRSGVNTVLKTGPGLWEKMAQKAGNKNKKHKVVMSRAVPTKSHMALVKLNQEGILKHLISQNIDGLHRRSGFNPNNLSELHGNTNLEKCLKCGKSYMRDYRVRKALEVHDHLTGKICDNLKCGGELVDTIVNFGENLPKKDMDQGFQNSKQADLHLVLGSSLRVTPAADIPLATAQNGNKLVVVNLQKTPLDNLCALRIYAMIDNVMVLLMKKLGLEIPEFILQRTIVIKKTNQNTINVFSEDKDGCPYDIFKQIVLDQGKKQPFEIQVKAPYIFSITNPQFAIKLGFFEHYKEGPFRLDLNLQNLPLGQKVKYLIQFSPKLQKWISCEKIE
ncbi:hypothetical protein ABPG72_004787 [Tetrahymena utriculariae]